jgi:hypothetical protein
MNPTVLTVNSSSIHVVAPLKFLRLVQEHLGEEYRLQDFIDLFVGPSTGRQVVAGGKNMLI